MGTLGSEFIKLRRSMSWAVVLLLPSIMVWAGTASTSISAQGFTNGWDTLWIRSIGFYGMAILSVGIAILSSLVWRVEHRNGNWNALASTPTPLTYLIVAKTVTIALLGAVMHIVFVIAVIIAGKIYGLPGILPARYFAASLLIIIACLPVAAIQSTISCLIRSFAIPIALALVFTGASTMALMMHIPGLSHLPYAALTHATQMGSTLTFGNNTVFATETVNIGSAFRVVILALTSTIAVIIGTSLVLNRSDIRA
ncbi:MAG: ABC transporter permease [Actinomycetaceae bacterium]|nr:ABC transporter permease [Actinomycetaceae bacterium]